MTSGGDVPDDDSGLTVTDAQPYDGSETEATQTRRRRGRAARLRRAEGRDRKTTVASVFRLLQEPATGASAEASVQQADEELRAAMSPAVEKLLEAVPDASSPEEAVEVLGSRRPTGEPEPGDDGHPRVGVAEDMVDTVVQYRVRGHFVRRPAVGHHERALADLVPASGPSVNGDTAADPAGYIAGFAERMRDRAQQDPN